MVCNAVHTAVNTQEADEDVPPARLCLQVVVPTVEHLITVMPMRLLIHMHTGMHLEDVVGPIAASNVEDSWTRGSPASQAPSPRTSVRESSLKLAGAMGGVPVSDPYHPPVPLSMFVFLTFPSFFFFLSGDLAVDGDVREKGMRDTSGW